MSNPSGLAPHVPSAGATADKASPLQMLTLALRILLVVAIVLLGAGPWLLDLNQLTVLTEFFTLFVLALMWNLLAGYADIVTVGQQGFVGVGAYAFFGLAALAGLDPVLSIILAAAIQRNLCISVREAISMPSSRSFLVSNLRSAIIAVLILDRTIRNFSACQNNRG